VTENLTVLLYYITYW